jgi:ubiquinone/menaquinone biosynthesis C-methylase UbiE
VRHSLRRDLQMPLTADESSLTEEVRRIRGVYGQRASARPSEWIPHFNLYGRYVLYERNEMLVSVFRKLKVNSLSGMKVLDVGCGGGTLLRYLFDFGVKPKDCFGVDVLEDTLRSARQLSPHVAFFVASGARLPFPDGVFDLVFQSLVFTSVLDPKIKRAMAAEILRVLKKGGRFVWYDFKYDNPKNANVRGIGKREIRQLLPACKLDFWRLTLAPPIGRIAGALSPLLYHVLSQVPFLRTHYLCLAEKQ